MPVNTQQVGKVASYTPSKEENQVVLDLMRRINDLKTYRSMVLANPYDNTPKARSVEDTWDYADYAALPHKYHHAEMRPWMSNNSDPMIFEKINTAVSILVSKNPEVEISGREEKFDNKAKLLEALYTLSWDKGNGRQQLIKFITNLAKYGFAIGREYHRYRKQLIKEMVGYDPDTGKHILEEKEVAVNDEPYFEVLPIRDCFFDNRAKPYDEESMRDWCWFKAYDYSTFKIEFPEKKFPNAKYINPGMADGYDRGEKDLADPESSIMSPKVGLWFYEDKENDQFLITDGIVLLYDGPLVGHKLSCVWGMWAMRNEHTIYGMGLPEILESPQELLDKIANMSMNQTILSIGGSGFYGGTANITEKDALLEPKLKKLKDADKIQFPSIPAPNPMALKMIEYVMNRSDETSGVTKSLSGEQVGKTLGESVLNKEAGLQRLALPLNNIEFALERHARLRVDNIQLIYGRPKATSLVVDDANNVIDDELFQEYVAMAGQHGLNSTELIQKFPSNPATGEVFKNEFQVERLSMEKTNEGEIQPTEQDKWLEITPSEVRGDYDVRIRAFSTLPLSQALEESKALETFNIVAKLPYTDIYKAQKQVLKARNEDPDDWMMDEQQIMQNQQQAAMAPPMDENGQPIPMEGGAETMVPPQNLEQPASSQGLSQQISQAIS